MIDAMASDATPVERRRARDGNLYTKAEFEEYYGDEAIWNEAEQEDAPPAAAESDPADADPGASQPGAPAAAGAESVAAPDASGALQPGPLEPGAADAAGPAAAPAAPAADPVAAPADSAAFQLGSREEARRRAVDDFRRRNNIEAPAPEPAAAPAAPNDAAPAAALTVEPDGLQLAVTLPPWHESEFLRITLPRQQAEFDASGYVVNVATNPRQAMNRAYQLEQYLPLPASAFVRFDLGNHLTGSQPLAVVAEKVLRLRDSNRPTYVRIEFFCYMPDGDVERHHPGRSREGDMQPHVMRWGCTLFNADSAYSHGVGAALHMRPPRLEASPGAPQPGDPLVIREDMNAMCVYDIQQTSWKRVHQKLRELGHEDQELDWSNGEHFPWWLWLANTGQIRNVANDGISRVRLSVSDGFRCVIVDSVRGTYRIRADHNGKPIVNPSPPLYDP